MERREQHNYKPLRSPAQEFPMCAVCNQRPDALIHAEHNEHTTLVEQRDLLMAAARKFVDAYKGKEHQLGNGQARRSLDEFRDALATVEQGHEKQAGGGSDDEQGEGRELDL